MTGVQTCALPISGKLRRARAADQRSRPRQCGQVLAAQTEHRAYGQPENRANRGATSGAVSLLNLLGQSAALDQRLRQL